MNSALTSMDVVRSLLTEVDAGGTLAPCGIGQVLVARQAADDVADVLGGLLSDRGYGDAPRATVSVLVDPVQILRGTLDLKVHVVELLRERFDVTVTVLDDGHDELHVSPGVVEEAARAVAGADAVVALGGGTISDIGKLAADQAGTPVLVSVQTAASVDGYTDDVSVLLRDGVKRTVPSRWPDAVIADLDTVAGAPESMNRAGYGEMTSMFTAPADWRLAALLGVDSSFHPGAVVLLDRVGSDLDGWSAGIRTAEPDAVASLTWALAVRGIATGVAGSTAALSGVEHLFSHMLDLRAGAHGAPVGLHGAQVGVGAVLAATAWELLWQRLAQVDAAAVVVRVPDPEVARARVEEAFAPLDPDGGITAECWRDYSRKLAALEERTDRLTAFTAGWREREPELRALGRPAAVIARGLRAAGAAAVPADLGVAPDVARWALGNCALMRNRLTVVDLLTVLGWWGPADVDEVLQRAEDVARSSAEVGAGHVS